MAWKWWAKSTVQQSMLPCASSVTVLQVAGGEDNEELVWAVGKDWPYSTLDQWSRSWTHSTQLCSFCLFLNMRTQLGHLLVCGIWSDLPRVWGEGYSLWEGDRVLGVLIRGHCSFLFSFFKIRICTSMWSESNNNFLVPRKIHKI